MSNIFKKFFEGLRLIPSTSSNAAAKGEMEVDDASGRLKYHDGTNLEEVVTDNSTDTLINKSIDADNNPITNIENDNIKASAAIELSKLEALTVSRVVETDGSGELSASTVTSTELGYVSGVTSSIQTQINTLTSDKVAKAGDTMTGNLVMGANKVTSSATPSATSDLTNKAYVDGVAQGLKVKDSVRLATTGPGTLLSDFSNGDTIDGQPLVTGNRLLIKNQADGAENGIYIVQASGSPVRSNDADTFIELVSAFVFVEDGSVNADSGWVCTANSGGTLGSTNLPFTQFAGAGAYTADGLGIEAIGTEFSLELDGTSLSKSSSGLKINSSLSLTGSTIATASDADLELSPNGTGEINSNSTHNFTAALKGAVQNDDVLYAASDSVTLPSTYIKRLTNVSTFENEIGGITAPASGSLFFVLTNDNGVSITIKNESSSVATAANRIVTGSGNDIILSDTACLYMFYDTTDSRWRAIGGSGGGGRITSGTSGSPIAITAAGGITTTAGIDEDIYVDTAGGEVNVTANPQISAGTIDGQTLRLFGTNDLDYIKLENGNGLNLNGDWYSYEGAVLVLSWDVSNTHWKEIGRN